MRKALAALLLVAVLLGTALPAQADWTPRQDLLEWVNQARGSNVRMSWWWSERARDHTLEMYRQERVFHSYRGTYCGCEVVGASAAGLRKLFEGWMDSSPHRATILYPYWDRVGVSVVARDGVLWATMIFR